MNNEKNPNNPHKLRKLAAGIGMSALSFLGVAGHNAGAQETPSSTPTTETSSETAYIEPAGGHEIVRPEGVATTTTAPAAEEYPPLPTDEKPIVRPEGVATTTTAPPEYPEVPEEAPIVNPGDATTTTGAPVAVSVESAPTTSSEELPHTGVGADTLALGGGAIVAAGAMAAAAAKRTSNKV